MTRKAGLHKRGKMPINYAPYVQNAFRELVRKVLTDVAQNGLPDGSHFFITFQTNRSDVVIPDFVRAKYPTQMSIVLQHQFEDLHADNTAFGVTLTFGGVASPLSIPYDALISFADPGTDFGFAFEPVPTRTPAPATTSAQIIDLAAMRKK